MGAGRYGATWRAMLGGLALATAGCLMVIEQPLPGESPARGGASGRAGAVAPDASAREVAETWDDPFAYCAAVGTIDAPDDRYVGPPMTPAVARGLQRALGLPPDAPLDPLLERAVWRCMFGTLYACTFGANLPCEARANRDRTPTPAMGEFCREHPGSDSIPYAVSGRTTVWDWRCRGTTAVPERQIVEADPRGFLEHIWHPLRAPVPAATPRSTPRGTIPGAARPPRP